MGLSFKRKQEKALDVTSGVIWKQMVQLMWPIFLSYLLQQVYGISNSIIVGQFAGKTALGGIQVTMPLMDLAVSLSLGIGAGCAVIVGQYFGEHADRKLNLASHTAMTISILGGILSSVIGVLTVRPLLLWMGTPHELMGEALAFGHLYFGAFMFSIILNMGAALLRAIGDTRTPLYVIGSTCIINIILDLVFVAGLKWEALGCGVATALSLAFGAVAIMMVLHRADGPWKIEYRKLRLDKDICILMLKTGIPLGIQAGVYSISNMIAQSAVNAFGTNSIASWGLALRINGIVWMVADSLSIAVTAFCAQNFGARNFQRMRSCLRFSLALTVVGIGALSALIYITVPWLATFFINDRMVTSYTAHIIRYIIPYILFFSVADCISGMIRSTGETVGPMILTILGTCVLRIAWIWIMVPRHHQMDTVLITYPISWVVTAILFIIYYRYGSWIQEGIRNTWDQNLQDLQEA